MHTLHQIHNAEFSLHKMDIPSYSTATYYDSEVTEHTHTLIFQIKIGDRALF